jgi:hypothetical protein
MAEQPRTDPQANAPYEEALKIALNKLTSEVFIFLLAYTILLIGIAVFGSGLTTQLRTLFYIIPILGVAAYIWLRRPNIVKKAAGDVRVRALLARGGANVIGVRGGPGQEQGNTDVSAGIASGSNVIGRDYGRVGSQSASDADAADVRSRRDPPGAGKS